MSGSDLTLDALAARGHGAVHVSEVGLLAAADAQIAERVIAETEILISKDEDFLTLRLTDDRGALGAVVDPIAAGRSKNGLFKIRH
jgi:hypothetical protein